MSRSQPSCVEQRTACALRIVLHLRTSGGSNKALSIRRDMTAVYFVILQIACDARKSSAGSQAYVESSMKLVALEQHSPEWVNHCGLIRCMIAFGVPPDSACYYATMRMEGGRGLGWLKRVVGCCTRLGFGAPAVWRWRREVQGSR